MMSPAFRRFLPLLTSLLLVCGACSGDTGGHHKTGLDADISGDVNPDAPLDAGDGGLDTNPDATADADGGTPQANIITCDNTLPTPSAGDACSTTSGSSSLVMVEGEVLAGDKIYKNGQVLIDRSQQNATITCVGCDCGSQPDANTATVVACPDSVVSPGLINPHEHLGWSTAKPAPHGDERYDHRTDWRTGARGHTKIHHDGSDYSNDAVLFGELRHMLSGVTSMAGSGGAAGFVRNLDKVNDTGGINVSVDYSTFPLSDTRGGLLSNGCGYPSIDSTSVLQNDIYLPHVSEGIDAEAENEFSCLSSDANGGHDLLADNTSIIHGIGLTAADIAEFAANGAQLVWSPRTNIDLYGNTADVVTYDHYGVTIALGTDWVISGSMNELRELQCADYLNQNDYDGHFSDQDLWKMATINGAIALGVGDKLGKIKTGYIADLAIYNATDHQDYRAVIDAGVGDVQLVMRGGEPLVGEPNVVQALVPSTEINDCESISVCDGARLICAKRDTGTSWATILGAANGNYQPFYCDTPPNEPSCVPMRPNEYDGMSTADDQDGDGVPDAQDVCPTIFDPPRPLDDGSQPDYDGDGIGDACDPCPLNDGDQCQPFDPNDRDGDGTANDADNCPAIANADQADSDSDGIGDACDTCPNFANPGNTGCPATIYDVWSGAAQTGDKVLIQDAVVTAVNQHPGEDPQGIFIQYTTDATDYTDIAHSGIYVYMKGYANFPQRGDNVDISAMVDEYGGAPQLTNPDKLTINSSGNTLPDPVVVDPADIATGGTHAQDYLNVLVRVNNVTVASAPDQYNEFAVDSGLRVDDLLYLITPAPQVGDSFDALIGPLVYSFSNTKVEPRDANDVILGPPALVSFLPQDVYLKAGTTDGATIPPLTATLSHPPAQSSIIAFIYSDSTVVSGPATITAQPGQTDYQPLLTAGGAAGTSATVTAKVAADEFTSTVHIYDDSTPRSVTSLDPTSQTVRVNQTATMTVTLDVPAPSGGQDVTITTTAGVFAPATVTVPADQRSVDFDITAGANASTDTVTATVGSTSAAADVTVSTGPSTPCLLISEYVEGSSFNKGLELYNCEASDMDLSNYGICRFSNSDTTCSSDFLMSGTLAAGDVITVCNSQADAAMSCDTTSGTIYHNGDDRYIIYKDEDGSGDYNPTSDTVTDAFGQSAVQPSSKIWADHTYRRCDLTPYYGVDPFDVTAYYTTQAKDDFSEFGTAPSASATCP